MQNIMSKMYQFMLVLLLTLCIIIVSQGLIMKFFVLSPNHWLKITAKSNFVEETTKSINQSIEDLGLGSGIQAGGLAEAISEEQVQKDFDGFLSNALKGTPFVINQGQIKQQLETAIIEYAKKEGQEINKENQVYIDGFVDAAYQKYDSGIRNQIISMVGLRTNMLDKLLTVVIGSALGMILVLLILLFLAERRYKHIFYRNLSHLCGSVGLLVFSINGMYYYTEPLKNLTIFSRSMKILIMDGLQLPLTINWIQSFIFILLGVGLGFLSYNEYLNIKRVDFLKKNRQENWN